MRNTIIILSILLGFASLHAQVGIETETVRGDGIMDFPEPATKGILLPRVSNSADLPAQEGTLVYNMAQKRVEVYNGGTNAWEAMTANATAEVAPHDTNTYPESTATNGAIVEAGTVTATESKIGVLVLESDDKALILPQVANASLLPSPTAGMICYDKSRKAIAVFNGDVWSYYN